MMRRYCWQHSVMIYYVAFLAAYELHNLCIVHALFMCLGLLLRRSNIKLWLQAYDRASPYINNAASTATPYLKSGAKTATDLAQPALRQIEPLLQVCLTVSQTDDPLLFLHCIYRRVQTSLLQMMHCWCPTATVRPGNSYMLLC